MSGTATIAAPQFTNEDKAREHLEAVRWPQGPFCPHCGSFNAKRLPTQRGRSTKAHPEGKLRSGVIQCNDCRQQYTVTVGTVFESSKVPLNKWLLANHLLCSSKKGMSAHQLHRMIGVTYKTAWFMFHRLREAMRDPLPLPLGGEGSTIEADETFVGGLERNKHQSKRKGKNTGGGMGKEAVFSLVERGGQVRSHHVHNISAKNLRTILEEQLADTGKTRLMTDGEGQYRLIGPIFKSHEVVNHGIGEYVRGAAHTNTIEGFFSILKRGINGCYFHVSRQHLHRYLSEFDFRYNNRSALGVEDTERAELALKGIAGKRLMYRAVRGLRTAN